MRTLSLFCSLSLFFSEGLAQWELRHPENQFADVSSVVFTNPRQGYFTTYSGFIFATLDSGKTWSQRLHVSRDVFYRVAFADSDYGAAYSPYSYLHDTDGVFFTTDSGENWTVRTSALTGSLLVGNPDNAEILPLSRDVWLFTSDVGQIIRTNNAFSTTTIVRNNRHYFAGDVGLVYGRITQFCTLPNGAIYALGNSTPAFKVSVIKDSVSYILKSVDNGSHWDTLWCGTKYALTTIAFGDSAVGWMAGEKIIIYKTTDGGLHWAEQQVDTPGTSRIAKIIAFDSSTVYGATESGDFFASTNSGATWTIRATKLQNDIYFCNPSLGYSYGRGGLFRTTDGGFHWTKLTGEQSGSTRRSAFVGDKIGFAIWSGQLLQTHDGGYNWNLAPALSNKSNLQDITAADSLTIWIVATDSVLHTTDGGKAWQSTPIGKDTTIRGIKFYGNSIGVQYEVRRSGDTVVSHYVTIDGGNTWKRYQLAEHLSSYDKLIFSDASHAWFFTQQGIFLSRDTSKTWEKIATPLGFNQGYDSPFDFVDSSFGCAASFDQVAITTDGGSTWTSSKLPFSAQLTDVAFADRQHGYISGWGGCIFSTSDGGNTWKSDETSSAETINQLLVVKNKTVASIYAVGNNLTVLHQTIVLSAAGHEVAAGPSTFHLYQNYPNPFNPVTVIRYQLAVNSFVTVKVFDILGREIATLVNEKKDAGSYTMQWDATKYSSDVYFYQLRAGSFVQTKKMVLLK